MADAAELEAQLRWATRVLEGAQPSVARVCEAARVQAVAAAAIERGFFRPDEDELLDEWFARALNLRVALWEVIEGCAAALEGDRPDEDDPTQMGLFVAGYTAACLVARLDRHVVEEVGHAPLVQRKLNEARVRHRIPAKSFTRIFESLTDPEKALRMRSSVKWVESKRAQISALAGDASVGHLVEALDGLELAVDLSKRRYAALAWAFMRHALQRRGDSARRKTTLRVMEGGGRIASELRDRWTPKRVTPELRATLAARMAPGDVLITRHAAALTNLLLPGYWPHAALVIGSEAQREALGVRLDARCRERAMDPCFTLEALKDGVRFRSLEETLAVDAVVLLRPRLPASSIARALERAATHEGKAYNFDFDFFRADRLVCTEVVYRAYDGVDAIELPLTERMGRPSLSAEDLLDAALAGSVFDLIAMIDERGALIEGAQLESSVRASYRE